MQDTDRQRLIPELLSPYLTQEQYDRAREYLKTPHTRVDLSLGEWDDLINGRGWPKGSLIERGSQAIEEMLKEDLR